MIPRAVLDTNILLRMIAGDARSELMARWEEKRFHLIMSLATLTELRTVLSRSEVQRYIKREKGEAFVILVEERSVFVQPDLSAPTCRDPDDTALIATAVGGKANYLVSADLDLLDDSDLISELERLGVHIVRAQTFLTVLKNQSTES